jgi:hypothetical protein
VRRPWDFLPGWPAALQARWSECYLAGAVAEFPFIAVETLIGLCHEHLFGERAMVHRLELDIERALVRLGWCLGGLLAATSVEHEQNSVSRPKTATRFSACPTGGAF